MFFVSARMGFRHRMKNFHYSLFLKERLGKIRTEAYQQEPLSPLISLVNPFPSSFIYRTMASVEKVLDHWEYDI